MRFSTRQSDVRALATVLCLTACIGWIPASQAAEPESPPADTRAWLLRMADAIRTLNYEGVLVYGSYNDMRTMRLVHRYEDGREQERMQTLSGDPVEILRDDNVVTCIHPRDHQVTVDRRELRGMLKDFTKLAERDAQASYQVRRDADTTILQRSCRVYSFIPHDNYRYGYRVYSDAATALPLRLETINGKRQVIEQIMFTQISFPKHISDAALTPSVDASKFAWTRLHGADGVRLHGKSDWVARQLPKGFQLVGYRASQPESVSEPIEHLLYSDGLAMVSVFVAPRGEGAQHFEGLANLGPVNAYGRHYDGYQISVLGDVPAATVELIGNNLSLNRK